MASNKRGTALVDGEYAEFQAAVLLQLPRDIDPVILRGWVLHQESLKKTLREALVPPVEDLPNLDWAKVYEVLGMSAVYDVFLCTEYSDQRYPTCAGLWQVWVLRGVTPNKVIAAFKKLEVNTYLYVNNLDKDVTKNDRDPNRDGSYVVSFRKTVEADPENANQSADDRKASGAKDIALLERLLLELGYFLATKKHLDVENWTLCSGSRCSDGGVPGVHWVSGDRRLRIHWSDPAHRFDALCSRAVVS